MDGNYCETTVLTAATGVISTKYLNDSTPIVVFIGKPVNINTVEPCVLYVVLV